MTSTLNPRQQQALEYTDGPLLVLAGAGSGKTSVITQKIAHLITACDIPAHRITAMTFTNKAAREMKERVGKLLPREQTKGLTVSTFHHFGLNFLRYELKYTQLKPNFSIMDGDDAKRLLKDLMHRDNLSGADSKELLGKAIHTISHWKSELMTPSEAMDSLEDPEDMMLAELYGLYERNIRAYNAVDFDDLIVLPTKLLREHAELRDKWQNRIRYLLVDEYQDTNTAQYELVKLLVGVQARFTAVGDDDQSIYAWRGAKPENMAHLQADFPKLKVIKLEQNYRSTSRILKAANAVITNNEHLFEKQLWSDKGFGEPIRVLSMRSEDDEAERVARDLVTHKLRHGNSWHDYAVLYRSNFQARFLEAHLRQLQVPYKLSGGTSFFAKSEIKDVMSYLRLILNPEDDSAFLRIINTPKRGLGAATLEKLGNFASHYGISLLAAAGHDQLSGSMSNKQAAELNEFAKFIAHFTEHLYDEEDPLPLVRQMIEETGYIDLIRAEAKTPQQEKNRLDNIEVLYQNIQTLINRAEDDNERNIEAVIRKLVLLDMLEQQQEEENTDKVSLSTLHAAKGLEFNHVYMIGLEEDMLPHKNSILSDTIEEERRLMYVGITRARESLTITHCAQRRAGSTLRYVNPSRFLDELPEDDLDWPARKLAANAGKDPVEVARDHIANLKAMLNKKK